MTVQRIVGLLAALSATTILCPPALLAQESPAVEIMAEDPQDEGLLTGDELDELFAPVALYPDALLGQLLLATTYPLELVKADTLLRQNAGKSPDEISALVAGQDYPDPVKALAAGFPDLVGRMVEHIGWVEHAGDALVAQTDDSIASIQRLRAQAKLMGYLEDNAAMTVEETDAGSISIASTNPEVVYVPQYTEQVYTTPAPSTPVYVTEENNWDDLLVTGALVWGGATLVNEIFDDDDDWDGRWNNYWNDGRYGNQIDWDGDVNIDNSIDIGNIDNRPNKRPNADKNKRPGKGDGKNDGKPGKGDGKPGQNNGKPGQGGDGKPGQNNGKPGQGGDGKPGQNNGKPGQGGDGKPGQNNGKPGQGGDGKPGQGAGGKPEVGQGGNAGGAIAGGVAGGIAGGAMNRPSTRPAGPSTRPAIDEARPGSVSEDRVKAAKGGNFRPTETDKEAARAKIKTRKAEGKPPAALPPAKSKGDRVGKPSTRPASAPKPKLTKPAPAKKPVVKAPAKKPTVSRPPSISKPKTTTRPSSASKPKTTVKRTPSFKPSGSGSRAKAASSRGKISRKGKR